MNQTTAKIILFTIISIAVLSLIVNVVLKTKVRKQPNKQQAYDEGLGYYTVEESLGCINDSLKCDQPGIETLVQYCIPNPVTGKGCIDLEGNETYNMVIRKKTCNIQCVANKFDVEDGIQIEKTPDGQIGKINGSGCNKVISSKFGIDYTNYFLGEYDTGSNKYELKNCLPDDERFQPYFQKTLTCTENDTKGQNNCVYSCGNEPGVIGLTGILEAENGETLLQYFPTEIDYTGNKRHVCYDINDIDQVDILNYKKEIPEDFVYPDLCYKHTNVLNYNGDLWPNSDASNVFVLNLTSYQPDSEYITVPGVSLNKLITSDTGLVSPKYDIFQDFNSYVKVFLGNEMTMLDKIMEPNGTGRSMKLFQNIDANSIVDREMSSTIFYFSGNVTNRSSDTLNKELNEGNILINGDKNLILDKRNIEFLEKKTLDVGGGTFDYMAINFKNGTKKNTDNYIYVTFDQDTNTTNLIKLYFYPENPVFDYQSDSLVLSFRFTYKNLDDLVGTNNVLDILKESGNVLYFEYESKDRNTNELIEGAKKYNYVFLRPKSASATKTILNGTEGYFSVIFDTSNNPFIPKDLGENSVLTSSIYVFQNTTQEDDKNSNITASDLLIQNMRFNLNSTSFKSGNIRIENTFSYPKSSSIENMFSFLRYSPNTILQEYNDKNKYSPVSLIPAGSYSLSSGNPWTYDQNQVNFSFISKGVYNCSINSQIFTFNYDLTSGNWSVVSNGVFGNVSDLTSNSLTFTLGGDTYSLTPSTNLLFTTLYYVYGNNTSETDTNKYFWYPIMISDELENKEQVSFTEYPSYTSDTVSLVSNNSLRYEKFSPPDSTEEFTYLCFNDDVGFADGIIEPVILSSDDNNDYYFFRNVAERTNTGNYQYPVTGSQLDPDNSFFLSNFNFTGFDQLFYYVYLNQEVGTDPNLPLTPINSVPNTLKLIRKETSYFDLLFNQTKELDLVNYKDQKLREYMSMISKQGNGYNETQISELNFRVILLPQKTVTLAADFRPFKSPYVIDEDNNYNFLCYNQNGVPLANGTRVQIGNNQKMIFNKFCTTGLNVEGRDKCGVLGINDDPNEPNSDITACIQARTTQNPSFIKECETYTKDKYNTLDNLFESGIILRQMKKAENFGERENQNTKVFDTFFTREEEDSISYRKNQELYINKNKQNFFISLKNNNLDFVVDPQAWERIFPYQNLTKSSVFQNHLYSQSLDIGVNEYNLGLGTTSTTIGESSAIWENGNSVYDNLKVAKNFEHRLVYKNATTGINTQNFFDSGVQFYYDSNNGAPYRLRARSNISYNITIPRKKNFYNRKAGFNLIKQNSNVYLPNLLGLKYGTGDWFNFSQHFLQGGSISTPDKYEQVTKAYDLIKDDYALPNIFQNDIAYNAFGEIVFVTTEERTENKIKITVTDSNLTKSYNNIVKGDFVNLDDNFYGPILSTLVTNLIYLSEYPESVINPTLGERGPSIPLPNLSLQISKNRSYSITTNTYDSNISTEEITIFDTFVKGLEYNKDIEKETTINFENSTDLSIQLYDIIVIYPNLQEYVDFETINVTGGNTPSFRNYFEVSLNSNIVQSNTTILPEFVRVISLETEEPDETDTTENKKTTIILERNIKDTPRDNLLKLNDSDDVDLLKKFLVVNLKKGGTLVDGFAEIQEISDDKVSFFLEIDDLTINVTQGDTNPNNNYDFYSTNLINISKSYFSSDTNPSENPNFFAFNLQNYQLSMRYIKRETQIAFSEISENLFASMTRKDDFEYYDTKLMSYVTDFCFIEDDGHFYYFNEFREEYSYGNPQISLTFSVGDQIEYITKAPNEENNSTGNGYTESIVAVFEVIEVDVVLEKAVTIGTNQNVMVPYNYKCKIVETFDTVSTNESPFNLSKSKFTFFNFIRHYSGYPGNEGKDDERDLDGSGPVGIQDTYSRINYVDPNDFSYQLPYTVYPITGDGYPGPSNVNQYNRLSFLIMGQVYGFKTDSDKIFVQEIFFNAKNSTLGKANFIDTTNGWPSTNVNRDYYKLLLNRNLTHSDIFGDASKGIYEFAGSTGSKIMTDMSYASNVTFPGGFIRGNKLDVLKLRSTSLRSVKNPNLDYINIEISSLVGKAYGSEFVMNTTKTEYPNYNRLGTILNFNITSSNLENTEVGDIFESDKGFQIILTKEKPSKYEFVSISENSQILPYDVETFQENTSYSKGSVTSVIDRNIRQYFRNVSDDPSKFSFNQQNTSNFEIIPRTIFPEDIFIDYRKDLYYQQGELVNLQNDPNEVSGVYTALRSNYGMSISADNEDFWEYRIFSSNLKSDNQNFYSFVYPEETITEGDQLNDIIEKNKTLNVLNLPFQLKTYDSDDKETDFCPNFCGKLPEDDIPNIITNSFASMEYFQPIKYLFDSPNLVKKSGSQEFLTLGHVPVSFNENNDYNVTFLSNSDDSDNLVSQFIYFLDLDNDQEIYNKRNCNGNFVYYDKDNTGGVDTGVSRFSFANSMLFQFIPCDLESQDFISYGISPGSSVVTFNDSYLFWSRFPPVNGVTTSSGTSIPLILRENENYSGVSGTFKTSYIEQNIKKKFVNDDTITLTNSVDSGLSVRLDVTKYGKTLQGNLITDLGSRVITDNGTNYSYGDIWYLVSPEEDVEEEKIITYGFVVPEDTTGKITENSFVQLSDMFETPNKCQITIISETGSGFAMDDIIIDEDYISEFTLTSLGGNTTSGKYTYGDILRGSAQLNIEFDPNTGNIIQQNQAYFESGSDYSAGTSIYFPSYNAKENIKVKALAKFGDSYLGRIKYNNLGFKSLENKILPATIFDNYSNRIFTNSLINDTSIVLANNENLELNGLTDVFKVKFNQDGTFSFKVNNFNRPINKPSSNLIQINLNDMSAINSNSVNSFTSKEMNNMIGVSVKLSFDQFIENNLVYNPANNKIPGNTNTQIQINEIREYRLNDFIDPANNCSLYFNNDLLPDVGLDGDTVFLSNVRQNQGGGTQVKVTKQTPYQQNESSNIDRFSFQFNSNIKYEEKNLNFSFRLGNNLVYFLNQTDSSNDGFPLVFSTDSGNNFVNNIIDVPEKNIGNGKLKIDYFLDFKEVTYSVYTDKNNFNNAVEERRIRIELVSDFNITNLGDTNIFYGFNQTKGQINGGKFDFVYH